MKATAGAIVEVRIMGWRAICAVLAAEGWPLSRFAASRASTRNVKPLPVDGPPQRPWSTRIAIVSWVRDERRRLGRTPL